MFVKICELGLKRMVVPALWRLADGRHGRRRHAQVVFLPVQLAVAADGQLQVVGQRVDDGNADAMQAARHFVGGIVELTARMQHSHDDFGGGATLFGMDIHRNSTAVVAKR